MCECDEIFFTKYFFKKFFVRSWNHTSFKNNLFFFKYMAVKKAVKKVAKKAVKKVAKKPVKKVAKKAVKKGKK